MSLGMASAPVTESDILVSSDGVTFARSLTESRFDELPLLVPTQSVTSELWVKNPTSIPATVRISLEDVDPGSGSFADNLTLTSFVEGTGSTRSATLRELDRCSVIVVSEPLAGSATLKVRFTAALGDLHDLSGQNESTPFVLRIDMRDSKDGGYSPTPCNEPAAATPPPGDTIAVTGFDAFVPSTAGGLLIAAGILVLIARRPRGSSAR
jgi:hypothetical protein